MIHSFCSIQIYKNQNENLTTKIILRLHLFDYENINHVWSVKSVNQPKINKWNLDMTHIQICSQSLKKSSRFHWQTLHKKWSFPSRISSVNETKSAVSCGFGHIYWRNLRWKTFFCAVRYEIFRNENVFGKLSLLENLGLIWRLTFKFEY